MIWTELKDFQKTLNIKYTAFPSTPVIVYKANPSLRKKQVQANLKPRVLDQTDLNPMSDLNNTQDKSQLTIDRTQLPLQIIQTQDTKL